MGKREFDSHMALYQEDESKVQADREKIDALMRGNVELSVTLAKEIFYKIKLYDINFETMLGLDFLDRITDTLSEEQMRVIRSQALAVKRKRKNKEKFYHLNHGMIVFIFAAVFLISFVYLNWNFFLDIKTNYNAYMLQTKIEDDMRTARITARWQERRALEEAKNKEISDQEVALAIPEQMKKPEIMGKFAPLYEENKDFAGWLTIEGTKIDYPVMSRQGDNNYYLDKNFEQKQDKNGLLILDYRCDVNKAGQNLIIYGHNMRTGVMFGTLKKYKDKEFCKEHPVIQFDSLYEECEYKVVAAMLSEVAYADEDVFRYYDAIDMSSEQDFEAFRKNIEDNALYVTDETISYGDSCLILSTCDKYKEDGRFVVIAKKVPKE